MTATYLLLGERVCQHRRSLPLTLAPQLTSLDLVSPSTHPPAALPPPSPPGSMPFGQTFASTHTRLMDVKCRQPRVDATNMNRASCIMGLEDTGDAKRYVSSFAASSLTATLAGPDNVIGTAVDGTSSDLRLASTTTPSSSSSSSSNQHVQTTVNSPLILHFNLDHGQDSFESRQTSQRSPDFETVGK
ncbi:unnamed protein product [Protopolystoma xenopodis]|uniref:Uncharacterized protein n=1 Tax=Protopolystoma xenopodis TaxID=117903 RepID=A0A3S5B5I7_9PLAT|nr:unnamed protein product [Protopolystoma xenopodis]